VALWSWLRGEDLNLRPLNYESKAPKTITPLLAKDLLISSPVSILV
jgi:hypothetical protein